jgi:hypothetical protein
MSELTGCLQTPEPKVFDFPGQLDHPPEPVSWALDLFAASPGEADMQSSEPVSDGQQAKTSYFDQHDPDTFERFKRRIESTRPVHGSLALIDYCAGDGIVRDHADWAWNVFET